MQSAEKVAYLKLVLGIENECSDETLEAYLELTGKEVLNWKYSLVGGVPSNITKVSPQDELAQIMACAAGFGHIGAPDQTMHNENGINRSWQHSDMLDYIRSNVIAFAGVR